MSRLLSGLRNTSFTRAARAIAATLSSTYPLMTTIEISARIRRMSSARLVPREVGHHLVGEDDVESARFVGECLQRGRARLETDGLVAELRKQLLRQYLMAGGRQPHCGASLVNHARVTANVTCPSRKPVVFDIVDFVLPEGTVGSS